ncbi:TatD family hydrolase [Paenactinomyces guangxiensis]|uniref:TatD family hydrolase n=1 Tax=Paenactinomyces guangxiensis TaxID=1490290 RepID=A0A7W1WTN3_9BACL|nr:TatD family hydrolase [Paenactinomyces guangxiensis]MBA4495832.1 TatD family hydrolase [Paenactinomyces guangxiensis]MBH8592922.1 TatD family hydrolase [Paenactinomyces guangxiensis]
MLFDSHAHINDKQFDQDRDEVIRRAREEFGVSLILNVGYNRETIPASLELAEKYDFIYSSVGWHPHDAATCTEEDLNWIRSLTNHPKVVALGEMGLDYYWDNSPRDKQAEIFRKQIAIARETGLPIIIHDRDAHEDVVRILQKENAGEVGGVMHCFGGDLAIMEECLKLNFMIGLGGPVTFKNAKLPKEIAARVPDDRLLIETDCPYLAPHPFRGKRNETGYVRLVAEQIAGIRGVSLEKLAHMTAQNAKRLFKLEQRT